MSFFKSIFKNYPYLTLFSLFLFLFFLIFNVFSWTIPQGNPPNNDLAPPLDTSSVEQTKSGNLILENNLTVGGILRLGRFSSHPTGTNGALYYNTTNNKFYGYSNNSWQELGSGAGGGLWTLSGNDIYNTNSGNVGIGTTAPSHKLDIALGGTNVKTYTYGLETTVNTTGGWARAMRFRNENNNVTAAFGSFKGNAYIATGFNINTDPTGYQTQRLTVTTAGNVGIGTTSPTEKLEVSGNIKLSGDTPTYRITNVAPPINDSDVATKGFVNAASGAYIVTTQPGPVCYWGDWSCCQSLWPNSWCPNNWTEEANWTFGLCAEYSLGCVWQCVRQTLCKKQ